MLGASLEVKPNRQSLLHLWSNLEHGDDSGQHEKKTKTIKKYTQRNNTKLNYLHPNKTHILHNKSDQPVSKQTTPGCFSPASSKAEPNRPSLHFLKKFEHGDDSGQHQNVIHLPCMFGGLSSALPLNRNRHSLRFSPAVISGSVCWKPHTHAHTHTVPVTPVD